MSAIDARGRWRVLPVSAPLREGDQVITGATGIAVLFLRDDTRIAMDPDSRLRIHEYRHDDAKVRAGRIRLELLRGSAQVTTGELAKTRPERFVFEAGGQQIRVHGTVFGANTQGQFSVRQGRVAVEQGGKSLGELNAGEMLDLATGAAPVKTQGSLPFQAPDPTRVGINRDQFFGPDPGLQSQSGPAAAGTYVHVRGGAVILAQGGGDVVLMQGETAMAPAGGGVPMKVRNGVQVAGSKTLKLDGMPGDATCKRDGSPGVAAGQPIFVPTAAARDQGALQFNGNIADKLTAQDVVGGGKTGDQLGGGNFGPGFGGPKDSAGDQARGTGMAGAGRLQAQQNVVTGRLSDTFGGNQVNSGGDVTLGGRPGRVGNVDGAGRVSSGGSVSGGSLNAATGSTGFAFGPTSSAAVAEMLIVEGGTPSGNAGRDLAEVGYAQSVGTGGYAATKNMSDSDRQSYWTASRNSQQRGGSGRPREDDNPSAGGSGVPIFLSAGQFGNELRGVERAINATRGAAGGTGDGRTDQQAGGGSTGGIAMQRGQQLGVVGGGTSGTLNWDAALQINEVVNPGRQ